MLKEGRRSSSKSSGKKRSRDDVTSIPKIQAPPVQNLMQMSGDVDLDREESRRENDILFEQRLQAIRKSAEEKKKAEREKRLAPIDYESPLPPPSSKTEKLSLFIKVAVGLSVVGVISLIAYGIFSSSSSTSSDVQSASKLKPEEEAKLKAEAEKFEEVLKSSPDDVAALEGASSVYAELGEYGKAEGNLERVVREYPEDVEALTLLAQVKSAAKDYEGSILVYRRAMKASKSDSMLLLRGLIESLLNAKKGGVAVDELLAARGRVNNNAGKNVIDALDDVQIGLLLGKAYSAWGKELDALAAYEGLIKKYPEDYRGYLGKAVMLKEQGKSRDAERMFIQARFMAPLKAKPLVDRYARS